jgi:hypothetical protein
MPYVSARYAPQIPLSPPDAPRQIVATDDQGQEWFLSEDSQVGDWLRYIEEGGEIEPYDEPATKPATDTPA